MITQALLFSLKSQEKICDLINPKYDEVEIGSNLLFNYPFVHLTGHVNIVLNQQEINNLRNYLIAGGFLHISDNYGLDPFIRKEIKKIFNKLWYFNLEWFKDKKKYSISFKR